MVPVLRFIDGWAICVRSQTSQGSDGKPELMKQRGKFAGNRNILCTPC